MDIAKKVAVVTGGGSGMGRATAELLREQGASVAILDLPAGKGAATAEAIGATFHPCDVTDEAATEQALADAVSAHGGIHVAVNTAGGGFSKRTISRGGPLPLADFRALIEQNLIATFNLNRLQAWHMSTGEPDAEGERGLIINTSSIAAFAGQIGQVAYSAAKAGIAGMSLTMARDLGSLGIRVMAMAPSLCATGLLEGAPDEIVSELTKDAAFPRRPGYPREFAWLAAAIIVNPCSTGRPSVLTAGSVSRLAEAPFMPCSGLTQGLLRRRRVMDRLESVAFVPVKI